MFNPETVPLAGRHLIEASAGTGKTYCVMQLYLRLMRQLGGDVDKVLVVTFTEMATAELVERIRSSLADELIKDKPHKSSLQTAMNSFDRARISTIHGFCSRVLREFPLHTDSMSDWELVTQQDRWLSELKHDFIVRFTYSLDPETIGELPTNMDLAKFAARVCADPRMPILADSPPAHLESVGVCHQRIRAFWLDREAEIKAAARTAKIHHSTLKRWSKLEDDAMSLVKDACVSVTEQADSIGFDHELVHLARNLLACARAWSQRFLVEFAAFARQELALRKNREHAVYHDDLLSRVDAALSGKSGVELVQKIRDRIPYAIVDEYQDTDPVQARVLERIYGDHGCLFMIGDPKQSIYAFRNADVDSYLRAARNSSTTVHRLTTNWRSSGQLVSAINGLFLRSLFPLENGLSPFLVEGIDYHRVGSAHADVKEICVDGEVIIPFNVSVIEQDELNEQKAASAAAAAIARFLAERPTVDGRPLLAADIAVLVDNHDQAAWIISTLRALGIPAAYQGARSVFRSSEADDLFVILSAILECNDLGMVRRALVTTLLGCTANYVHQLNVSGYSEWMDWLSRFQVLRDLWHKKGFARMFRAMLDLFGIEARLIGQPGGERKVTNILHLGERLSEMSSRHHLGPAGLVSWLFEAGSEQAAEDEMRLETDEHAVQVMTIHKSKGLEFPAVFCPYMWKYRSYKAKFFETVSYQGTTSICLTDSDYWLQLQAQAEQSAAAESMRLVYVALTRASSYVHVITGDQKRISPLNGLILGICDWHTARTAPPLSEVSELWRRSGLLRMEKFVDAGCDIPTQKSIEKLTYRALARTKALPMGLMQSSFSMMTSQSLDLAQKGWIEDEPSEDERGESISLPLAFFPRGSHAGTCLHRILEMIDFSSAADWRAEFTESLNRFGYSEEWADPLFSVMESVVTTPLQQDGMTLSQVTSKKRLNEWSFTLPMALVTGEVSPESLLDALSVASSPTIQAYRPYLLRLHFRAMKGFLKGIVDLVFEHRGRWYVIDYKSNDLGDHQLDYHHERLVSVMAKHHYVLQYHIYVSALHRHLKHTLPGYDYQTHFGGVAYLFLRGMTGDATYGVFRDRPPQQRIEALDKLWGLS